MLPPIIGMTTRHLGVKSRGAFGFKKRFSSTERNTLMFANSAKVTNIFLIIFLYLTTCNTQYSTKIQALLMKKHNPKLNTQLYANGSSFFHLLFCVWCNVQE